MYLRGKYFVTFSLLWVAISFSSQVTKAAHQAPCVPLLLELNKRAAHTSAIGEKLIDAWVTMEAEALREVFLQRNNGKIPNTHLLKARAAQNIALELADIKVAQQRIKELIFQAEKMGPIDAVDHFVLADQTFWMGLKNVLETEPDSMKSLTYHALTFEIQSYLIGYAFSEFRMVSGDLRAGGDGVLRRATRIFWPSLRYKPNEPSGERYRDRFIQRLLRVEEEARKKFDSLDASLRKQIEANASSSLPCISAQTCVEGRLQVVYLSQLYLLRLRLTESYADLAIKELRVLNHEITYIQANQPSPISPGFRARLASKLIFSSQLVNEFREILVSMDGLFDPIFKGGEMSSEGKSSGALSPRASLRKTEDARLKTLSSWPISFNNAMAQAQRKLADFEGALSNAKSIEAGLN